MEIIRPAFQARPVPILSYGIPFPEASARHVINTFHARRVYVICSRSLAQKTSILVELDRVFGTSSISLVGQRVGMKPHTLWSEVLDIAAEARACEADVFLTIGGGTLTDGAKAVVLALANSARTFDDLHSIMASQTEAPARDPATSSPNYIPIISVPTTLSAAEYSCIAAIRLHQPTGAAVFFGNITSAWSRSRYHGATRPPFCGDDGSYHPPPQFGDRIPMEVQDLDILLSIAEEGAIDIVWEKGDLVILDVRQSSVPC
ncbi:hypothetical protein BJX99DRAFT_253447 [Aspergillus californicus]